MIAHAIVRRPTKLPHFARAAGLSPALALPAETKNKFAPFVSTLVHEVRNPLCNIGLALEMLQLTTPDEQQQQYLGIITRGADRIKDLINTLLLLDKAYPVALDFYLLHQLLDDVLFMAKDRISLKNITVHRDYAKIERSVLVEKEQMKIALTNIIINAIDAMPAENGELKLVTKSTRGLDIIEIHDNGVGISKENLQKIFKPYFTNKAEGLGLGLSATLDILHKNHTRVHVLSEEGIGTSFILSFDKM